MFIVEDANGIKRGVFWWQPTEAGMMDYPDEASAMEAAKAFANLSR